MKNNTNITKRDFINLISGMTNTELNDYIKSHGKPPKQMRMFTVINNETEIGEWIKKKIESKQH